MGRGTVDHTAVSCDPATSVIFLAPSAQSISALSISEAVDRMRAIATKSAKPSNSKKQVKGQQERRKREHKREFEGESEISYLLHILYISMVKTD
jgi:hypothetical protein